MVPLPFAAIDDGFGKQNKYKNNCNKIDHVAGVDDASADGIIMFGDAQLFDEMVCRSK